MTDYHEQPCPECGASGPHPVVEVQRGGKVILQCTSSCDATFPAQPDRD